jgi:hypothetical protein
MLKIQLSSACTFKLQIATIPAGLTGATPTFITALRFLNTILIVCMIGSINAEKKIKKASKLGVRRYPLIWLVYNITYYNN